MQVQTLASTRYGVVCCPIGLAVQPFELPGRGSRLGEPCADNIRLLPIQLAIQLSANLEISLMPIVGASIAPLCWSN